MHSMTFNCMKGYTLSDEVHVFHDLLSYEVFTFSDEIYIFYNDIKCLMFSWTYLKKTTICIYVLFLDDKKVLVFQNH